MNFLSKIALFVGAFLLFVLGFLSFIDKQKLFYSAQDFLSDKYGVLVYSENIESGAFSMNLQGLSVYYNKSLVAKADGLSLSLLGFEARKINLENMLKKSFDFTIDKAWYSLFDFDRAFFNGAFGEAKLVFDFANKKATIVIQASNKLKSSSVQRYFKRVNGELHYEFGL